MPPKAAVVVQPDDKPNTFGWLQMEKKTALELQKLAIKSPTGMATLMMMINRMSRTNALVISQQAIADELGVTRRSIVSAIATLEKSQFIETLKVGTALVYCVNTRVAWQGIRGARYAHFGADIYAVEKEQDKPVDPPDEPLKSVPSFGGNGERIIIGNEPLDPPDQQELTLT